MDNVVNIVLQAQDEASDKIKSFGDNLQNINPIGVAVGRIIADLGEKIVEFAENNNRRNSEARREP